MASTTSGRGGAGWVILFAALAVPGVLFYNWWSHLKGEREKTVAAKARGRIGAFLPSAASGKLVNPMSAPAASTPTAIAALAAPVPVKSAAPPVSPVVEPDTALPAPETSETTAASDASTPAAATAALLAAPQAAREEEPVSRPETAPFARDPMLSPFDNLIIKEEEERKRQAQQRLEEERRRPVRRSVKREPDPATFVDLQGIVAAPEGQSKAIVNNEVVAVGQVVAKVRVVRITSSGVTFEYKGRKFTKSVSRE